MDIDLNHTLEQIEKEYWGDPTYNSHLVITCHQLRKKPLKCFTVEDLRIMIGQNISLEVLMPIAMERLQQNIMAEGDHYPGDLLKNVLSADISYWQKNPSVHHTLRKLFKDNLPSIEKMTGHHISKGIFMGIIASFEEFNKINN